MSKTSSTVFGVAAASALMVGACGGAPLGVAVAQELPTTETAHANDLLFATNNVIADPSSQVVRLPAVEGAFSFQQGLVDSTEHIAQVFKKAPTYLCGASADQLQLRSDAVGETAGTLTVKGDVRAGFTANLSDLASADDQPLVLGCACGGNPVDGRASVTAEVTGVTVRSILERAQVNEGANTIAFTSSDGYEVALPLSYVTQRYSLIVYAVNGESVENVMGGSNQLWLGSTSARYFARDIVSVELRTQETPPPAPGTAEARDAAANTPNITVFEGDATS